MAEARADLKARVPKAAADPNEPKPFLAKLYKMVDDPDTDHIISWLPNGEGLIIQEVESFVSMLLPQHFKHSNLSSFVRQLNTYGFSKVGPDAWVFAHPHFRRGDLESLNLIQRKSSHRPPSVHANASAETGDDQDVPPDNELRDEELRQELAAMRNHHANMAQRISDLSEQIKVSRAKQANTKSAIAKIMTFLSQVYNANQSNFDSNNFLNSSSAKRRRIEARLCTTQTPSVFTPQCSNSPHTRYRSSHSKHHSVLCSSNPPPTHQLTQDHSAAISPRVESLSPKLDPSGLIEGIGSTPVRNVERAGGIPTIGDNSRSTHPHPLVRTPSLGQQAAMALPPDLQEIALQLIDSTELQDQCLKEVREGLPHVDGVFEDVDEQNNDLETFLWDFLETSQDAVEHAGGFSHDQAESPSELPPIHSLPALQLPPLP